MDMLIFKEAEFLGRIALCQKRQREQGFNGMLVSAEANINYYSGYRTHAPWTTFTHVPLHPRRGPSASVHTDLRHAGSAPALLRLRSPKL